RAARARTCPRAGPRHRHRFHDVLRRPRDPSAGRASRPEALADRALHLARFKCARARAILPASTQPRRRTRHPDYHLTGLTRAQCQVLVAPSLPGVAVMRRVVLALLVAFVTAAPA